MTAVMTTPKADNSRVEVSACHEARVAESPGTGSKVCSFCHASNPATRRVSQRQFKVMQEASPTRIRNAHTSTGTGTSFTGGVNGHG